MFISCFVSCLYPVIYPVIYHVLYQVLSCFISCFVSCFIMFYIMFCIMFYTMFCIMIVHVASVCSVLMSWLSFICLCCTSPYMYIIVQLFWIRSLHRNQYNVLDWVSLLRVIFFKRSTVCTEFTSSSSFLKVCGRFGLGCFGQAFVRV